MGDILHALPAVTALRRTLPGAHLGWAVEPRWRPLLSPALIDQIHEIPTRDWKEKPVSVRTLKQVLALRRDFRDARYDLTVDLQGSIRSAFLARLSGASRVFGPATPREAPARTFYTHRVTFQKASVIAQAAELLHAATGLTITPVPPLLPPTADVPGAPYLLIAPTAGWGAKQWPIPAYNELIQRLESLGHTILLNTPNPRDPILAGTRARAIYPTLPELIALTRSAALVLGGDTGPVHLASALGVRTVALFGPTDPARNGPLFPRAEPAILRHPTSLTDHRRHSATEAGLARITVEEVLQAVLQQLRTL